MFQLLGLLVVVDFALVLLALHLEVLLFQGLLQGTELRLQDLYTAVLRSFEILYLAVGLLLALLLEPLYLQILDVFDLVALLVELADLV